jgi:malate dehydrogenase (oxaloacetate-decarboxylating)
MSAMEFMAGQRGVALLEDPIASKGTAFDAAERRALGLDGLLPPAVETLGQQAQRAYEAFSRYADDLARHIYLRAQRCCCVLRLRRNEQHFSILL